MLQAVKGLGFQGLGFRAFCCVSSGLGFGVSGFRAFWLCFKWFRVWGFRV